MAGSAGTRKKRRIRSPHPGVVLIKPDAEHTYWRARFVDPDTGRATKVRLDPVALTTAETRRDWAIKKSRELARTRMDYAVGGPRVVRKPLEEAIAGYFKAAEDRLRPRTVELYRVAADMFEKWAERDGIESTDALTPTNLPGFRDYLLSQRKQGYVAGGKRGQRRACREKLSPLTINWKLRAMKTLLNDLRMRGIVRLSSDAIADGLKPVTVPREAPEFLTPAECGRLLEAALRHDAEHFVATRDELDGLRPVGTTPRYEPIAPFVAVVLLTGMRVGEALALRWEAVDLGALDADGKEVGEIRLKASETKTGHARKISLDVSPYVRLLLAAMKLRAAGAAYVFGGKEPMLHSSAEAARRRLIGSAPKKARKANPLKKRKATVATNFGAPDFSWQLLRSTCATYQCNAPSLFGDAAAFVSAKRLGHSVTVSEKHYAGLFAVSREARTLEQAMQIEDVMRRVVESVGVKQPALALVAT